jgi:hypothetical protein
MEPVIVARQIDQRDGEREKCRLLRIYSFVVGERCERRDEMALTEEDLSQCQFVLHKSLMGWPGIRLALRLSHCTPPASPERPKRRQVDRVHV